MSLQSSLNRQVLASRFDVIAKLEVESRSFSEELVHVCERHSVPFALEASS